MMSREKSVVHKTGAAWLCRTWVWAQRAMCPGCPPASSWTWLLQHKTATSSSAARLPATACATLLQLASWTRQPKDRSQAMFGVDEAPTCLYSDRRPRRAWGSVTGERARFGTRPASSWLTESVPVHRGRYPYIPWAVRHAWTSRAHERRTAPTRATTTKFRSGFTVSQWLMYEQLFAKYNACWVTCLKNCRYERLVNSKFKKLLISTVTVFIKNP